MGRASNRKIDLDARRRARAAEAEADHEPVEITFGDSKFELPAELPWRFASLLFRGEVDAALAAAFGESEYERFMGLDPSVDDVQGLVEDLSAAYGLSEGESLASASSS